MLLSLEFLLNDLITCECVARLAGKYRTQLWDKQTNVFLPSTPGLGMHVEIKDPDAKVSQEEVVFNEAAECFEQKIQC